MFNSRLKGFDSFLFLYRSRHKEEARIAGVSDVIDLDIPDEDELERDLILLAQQQEKLLAELALAYEEENERERGEVESGRRAAFDQEMEARVKAMNLSVAPEEIEGAFEEVREVRDSKSKFVKPCTMFHV